MDSPAAIVKKVKGAKTDTFEGLEFDNPERPEARNLLTIYQLATGMSMVRLETGVKRHGISWLVLKSIELLREVLVVSIVGYF